MTIAAEPELLAPQDDEALLESAYDSLDRGEFSALHAMYVAGEATTRSPSEADFKLVCMLAKGGIREPADLERVARGAAIAESMDLYHDGQVAATHSNRAKKWARRDYVPKMVANALRATKREWRIAEAKRTPVSEESPAMLVGYSDRAILALPDPEWLIDGLLPAAGLVEVVGRYGAGKTFLLIDWLMHVAAGMDWQGRKVLGGQCLYVYGEGAMKPRIAAWRTAHRIRAADTVGVTFVPGTVNLLDGSAVDAFIEWIGEAKPAAIVLDTLSRMVPGDENSPEHGALVVASCGRIQRATGASVVLGHHTPWSLDTQRPKGSSKIPDCADAVFLLENDGGALALRCQKMRDGEAPPPIHLKLTKVDGALVVDRGAPPVSEPTTTDRLLAALVDGPLTKEELAAQLRVSRRTLGRLLREAGTRVQAVPGSHGGRGSPVRFQLVGNRAPIEGAQCAHQITVGTVGVPINAHGAQETTPDF